MSIPRCLLALFTLLVLGAGCADATPSPIPLTPGTPDEVETGGGLVDTLVVRMTQNGFEPQTLTIQKGETVLFSNEGTRDIRPASNPHPVHSDYPEFDARENIIPGQFWNYTFEKVGTWNYHDHNNETLTGTIIVTE